jgi:hypothetical protein
MGLESLLGELGRKGKWRISLSKLQGLQERRLICTYSFGAIGRRRQKK